MTLHIMKTADPDTLSRLSSLVANEDKLLLIEDACYMHKVVTQQVEGSIEIFALEEHMQNRGLLEKAKSADIVLLSFKDWVLLTHKHPQAITW